MSAEPVDIVDVAVRRSPRRALVQAIVSRGMMVLLVAVAGGALLAARADTTPVLAPMGGDVPSDARALRPTSPAGATMATILEGLEEASSGAAGRLAAVDVVVTPASRATITLTFEGSGGTVTVADRIVGSLVRLGFDGPRPRSIVPTPSGSRIDVTTGRQLSVERLPSRTDERRPLANLIADTVARSGAELVRLEVPDEAAGVVRLGLRGTVEDVVLAIALLEREHTAPVRFVSIGLRAVGEREREAALAFRVRDADPTTSQAAP